MSFNLGNQNNSGSAAKKFNIPFIVVGGLLVLVSMYLYASDNIPDGMDGGLPYILRFVAVVAGMFLLVRGLIPRNRAAKKTSSSNNNGF